VKKTNAKENFQWKWRQLRTGTWRTAVDIWFGKKEYKNIINNDICWLYNCGIYFM